MPRRINRALSSTEELCWFSEASINAFFQIFFTSWSFTSCKHGTLSERISVISLCTSRWERSGFANLMAPTISRSSSLEGGEEDITEEDVSPEDAMVEMFLCTKSTLRWTSNCARRYAHIFGNFKKQVRRTFTMVKNQNTLGCINRDRNACLNMWKLVTHYLDTGEWLPAYKRSRE